MLAATVVLTGLHWGSVANKQFDLSIPFFIILCRNQSLFCVFFMNSFFVALIFSKQNTT